MMTIFGGMYRVVEEIKVENLYTPYSTINKPCYTSLKNSLSKNKNNDLKINKAVISVGENPYEHPNGKVLMRLKNVNTYRTDNQNTIWLKSDGNSININPIKNCILDGANRKI